MDTPKAYIIKQRLLNYGSYRANDYEERWMLSEEGIFLSRDNAEARRQELANLDIVSARELYDTRIRNANENYRLAQIRHLQQVSNHRLLVDAGRDPLDVPEPPVAPKEPPPFDQWLRDPEHEIRVLYVSGFNLHIGETSAVSRDDAHAVAHD